ncbi:hypothetical protein GS444_20640 [Rhodococcus hoagii]|nr:hypothetical protein [Prescottella equi]
MVTPLRRHQRLNVWTSLLVFVIAPRSSSGSCCAIAARPAGTHATERVARRHAPEGDDGVAVAAGRSGSHAVGAAEDDAVRR